MTEIENLTIGELLYAKQMCRDKEFDARLTERIREICNSDHELPYDIRIGEIDGTYIDKR